MTGAKRKHAERLSERTRKGCDSLNSGITKEAREGTRRGTPPERVVTECTTDTWKARTLGKMPHILTYGMEGLEGLRVGNADALEIRIAYYGNVICSAPGYNMQVALSA